VLLDLLDLFQEQILVVTLQVNTGLLVVELAVEHITNLVLLVAVEVEALLELHMLVVVMVVHHLHQEVELMPKQVRKILAAVVVDKVEGKIQLLLHSHIELEELVVLVSFSSHTILDK
tara:strand:+ start:1674 stop:2027 length:354 start_codon:yes stop_codon:yes gene_type:complete